MTPMQTTPPSPFNAFNAQQPQVQNPFTQTTGGGFGMGQQPPQNPFMGGQVDTGMNYTPGVQQPQQLSGNTMGGTGFGFQSTIPPYMPPNVQQQQMAQQAAQQQALQQAMQQTQMPSFAQPYGQGLTSVPQSLEQQQALQQAQFAQAQALPEQQRAMFAAQFQRRQQQLNNAMQGQPNFAQPYGQQMGSMAQQAAQQQALQQALQQAQFMAQAPQQLGGQANPVLAQIEQAQMAQRTVGGPMQSAGQIQQIPLGLAALLGGQPRPAPAMAPNPGKPFQPPQQVAPRPAPASVRPSPAPSQVPPRTPPAVANAIRGLAAKNPMGIR